ncbi:MAG: hypothetical protein MJ065_08755 [Oscillospiraceae bacterium]|nr:hypothetical protein [Oscillospiraceae bacterium]
MQEPDRSAERERRKEALRRRLAEQAAVPEQFIVGGGHKMLPLCFALTGAALVYTLRKLGEDWYVNGTMPPLLQYLFPIVLVLCGAVLCIILLVSTCLHPKLGVQGKSFYHRKKWYTCEEIWEIRISRMSRIQIFTSDKMLASFPWAAHNADTFIAWAKKYGVSVRDERIGIDG